MKYIAVYGEPVLRSRASPIKDLNDPTLDQLAENMTTLMQSLRGIGLAGNQVHRLQRIIVWSWQGKTKVLFNPEIVRLGAERESAPEACLSIFNVVVQVPRAIEIDYIGWDLERNRVRQSVAGIEARILQHEIDHLDGKLILDRTPVEQRRQALGALRNRQPYSCLNSAQASNEALPASNRDDGGGSRPG